MGQPFTNGYDGFDPSGRAHARGPAPTITGAGFEEYLHQVLIENDIATQRAPGVVGFDQAGHGIRPDFAVRLPVRAPMRRVAGGFSANVLLEAKYQCTAGSAAEKLPYTLSKYAALSDSTGLPCVVVYRAEPGVWSPGFVAMLHATAKREMVGLIDVADLTAQTLTALCTDLVRLRSAMMRTPAELDELLKLMPAQTLQAALRRAVELELARVEDPGVELDLQMP